MAEEIVINIIAYDDEGSGATQIATFASEEIYQQCWPALEKYLEKKGSELSESAERNIIIPDVDKYERDFD
jgi:hypothetical protein